MADSTAKAAMARLMSEYKGLHNEKWVNITINEEQMFRWQMALLPVNEESYYSGGYFKVEMTFTKDYPYKPPTFKFLRPIYHPNVYPDGKVCISILHPPGEDEQSGESATERWSPLQGVESILRSVLLLLDEPEVSSPANVDAGVMYRKDRKAYIQKANVDVDLSKKDIPEGFVMPTSLAPAPPAKEIDDDEDFWAQGPGSESDEEMTFEDDDDDEGDQEFEESGDDDLLREDEDMEGDADEDAA